MSREFNKIGLIGKYGDPGAGDTLLQLSQYLQDQNCEVVLEDNTAATLPHNTLPVASQDEIGKQCDLAITVGGDGSLLNAARNLIDFNIPPAGHQPGTAGLPGGHLT